MKFNRYKIVENDNDIWKYTIYKRSIIWPFWLEWKNRDHYQQALDAITEDKSKPKVLHLE